MSQASGRTVALGTPRPSSGSVSGPSPSEPPPTPGSLTTEDRAVIDAILQGFPPKAKNLSSPLPIPYRAATLLNHPVAAKLDFSASARLLYLLLSHYFSITGAGRDADSVSVPIGLVARRLNISKRSASRVIAELTRTGTIPLLLQDVGKPGKASRYTFVYRPFELLAIQDANVAVAAQRRQTLILDKQKAIFAAGALTPDEQRTKLHATSKLRTHGTRQPKPRTPRTRTPNIGSRELMHQSQYDRFSLNLETAGGIGPDGRTLSQWYVDEAARYQQLGIASDEFGYDFDYWQDRFQAWVNARPTLSKPPAFTEFFQGTPSVPADAPPTLGQPIKHVGHGQTERAS